MVGVRVLMEPILSLHYVAEISLSLRSTSLKSGNIEQVLMRNIKAVGGLTRGRGFEQSKHLPHSLKVVQRFRR